MPHLLRLFLLVLCAVAAAMPAAAQERDNIALGVRTGVYFDPTDLFFGGEVLVPLSGALYLNPNIEYVLGEGGTVASFNLDAHYDFPLSSPTYVWFGLGFGLLYADPDGPVDGELDPGLNILLGLGFDNRLVIPYTQLKVLVADNNQVSLAFGLRF